MINEFLVKYNLVDKNNNINKNYRKIINCITDEQDLFLLKSSFTEYDDLSFKIKAMINSDYKRCLVCENVIDFKVEKRTCSKECSKVLKEKTIFEKYGVEKCTLLNKDIKEKSKKTSLEKYGVEYPSKSNIVKEKIKNTNIDRYGVEYPLQDKKILDKTRESTLEKYGVEYPLQDKKILEKSKQSLIDNHEISNPMYSEIIKDKLKKTNLERYGYESAAKSEIVKEKTIQTNLERYGYESAAKSEIVKENMRKSYFEKNKKYIEMRLNEMVSIDEIERLNINRYTNYSEEYLRSILSYDRFKQVPSLSILKYQFKNTATFYKKALKYNHTFNTSQSSYEYELVEFLKSNNIKYITSNREIITPYELDIYIPEYKLAIELNGYYWHSDKFKDKHYHQMKTKMCNELGITLIHIHEYDYLNKREIFKSIIKSKLQLNERVYARKCVLKEVPKQEEKDFLNKYHLQGFVGSSKCYGLYYNDELLTLCSFGKSRFNKNYEYELLRNCSKPNNTVVGGLSKIIKHYKKEINYKEIICYSDASISYNKSSKLTQPNYVWIKNGIVYKRYQTQKHKLSKLLGDSFDENLSESENMKNNNFIRVYDSGNYITIY